MPSLSPLFALAAVLLFLLALAVIATETADSPLLIKSRLSAAARALRSFHQQQQAILDYDITKDSVKVVERAFQRFSEPGHSLIVIRGMFSSGTGWLRNLLQSNCNADIQFSDKRALVPQERKLGIDADGLYGWKHTYFNAYERAKLAQHASHKLVVIARDAITWAYSTFKMRALVKDAQDFPTFVRSRAFEPVPNFAYLKHFYRAAALAGNITTNRDRMFGPNLYAANVFAVRRQVYYNWLVEYNQQAGGWEYLQYETLRADDVNTTLQLLSRFGIVCRGLTAQTFKRQEYRVKMREVSRNVRMGKTSDERREVCHVLRVWPNLYAEMLAKLDLVFEREVLGYEYAATWQEYCGQDFFVVGKENGSMVLAREIAHKQVELRAFYEHVYASHVVQQVMARFEQRAPIVVIRGMAHSGTRLLRNVVNNCSASEVDAHEEEFGADADNLYGWQHSRLGAFERRLFDMEPNHFMLIISRDAIAWAIACYQAKEDEALVEFPPPTFNSFVFARVGRAAPTLPAYLGFLYTARDRAAAAEDGPELIASNIFQARKLVYSSLFWESNRTRFIRARDVSQARVMEIFQEFGLEHNGSALAESLLVDSGNNTELCETLQRWPELYLQMLAELDLEFESQVLGYEYPSTWQAYCDEERQAMPLSRLSRHGQANMIPIWQLAILCFMGSVPIASAIFCWLQRRRVPLKRSSRKF